MRRLLSRILHAAADALIYLTVRVIVWAVELEDDGESGANRGHVTHPIVATSVNLRSFALYIISSTSDTASFQDS